MTRGTHVATTGLAAITMALWIAAPAARTAEASNGRLSEPYNYTVGDDIAVRTEAVFRATAGLESATMVTYDRKTHNLVGDVYGSTDDPEGAKREMEGYVTAFLEVVAPYAKKRHGVTLTRDDLTLVYYNDTGDEPPYEVIRLEGGKFVEPKAVAGE